MKSNSVFMLGGAGRAKWWSAPQRTRKMVFARKYSNAAMVDHYPQIVSTPWRPDFVGASVFAQFDDFCKGAVPQYVLTSGTVQALVAQVNGAPCVFVFAPLPSTPSSVYDIRAVVHTLREIVYEMGLPKVSFKSSFSLTGPTVIFTHGAEHTFPCAKHLSPLGVIFETSFSELSRLAYQAYLCPERIMFEACGLEVSHDIQETAPRNYVSIRSEIPAWHVEWEDTLSVVEEFVRDVRKIPTVSANVMETLSSSPSSSVGHYKTSVLVRQGVFPITGKTIGTGMRTGCTSLQIMIETMPGNKPGAEVNAAVQKLIRRLLPMCAAIGDSEFITDVQVHKFSDPFERKREKKDRADGTSRWVHTRVQPRFPCVVLDDRSRVPIAEREYMAQHPLHRFARKGSLTAAISSNLGPSFHGVYASAGGYAGVSARQFGAPLMPRSAAASFSASAGSARVFLAAPMPTTSPAAFSSSAADLPFPSDMPSSSKRHKKDDA